MELDVGLLKSEIRKTYASVSQEPDTDLVFPHRESLGGGPRLPTELVPDKDAVFGELHRVLVPGGRIQIADVTIERPVSDAGRSNIDLWTG